jgi:anti-anti-sigma regulatory factor
MSIDPFEVSELAPDLPAAVREAALLHARGETVAARAVLEAAVAAASEIRACWHLLLELERLAGRWSQYEALAARYRMRFGDDPPSERERREREARLPSELRAGGSGCVALGGILDASQLPALSALRAAAGSHVVVHLDLSRLTGIDAIGCGLLHAALEDLVTNGTGLVLSGAERLTPLLAPLLGQRPPLTAVWSLRLLTLRLARDHEGFDRAALAGAEDAQLIALAEYAAVNQYVNIELSAVDRIDPEAVGVLANLVSSAAQAGRTVRLIRPNSLVAVLFRLLNLGRHATIVTPFGP